MIHIIVARSHKLPLLREAIAHYNQTNPPSPWGIFEIQRFDIVGIPISRCVFVCDSLPPEGIDVVIEETIPDVRYCPECLKRDIFKALPKHNKSGYCAVHQDKNPVRNERKKRKY